MSDAGIRAARIRHDIKCRCGHSLTPSGISINTADKIEVVCPACHETVIEIELDISGDAPWD